MKHCIFDLGNVLFRFDLEHILAYRFAPEVASEIAPIFFDRRIWDRMDDGTISDRDAKDAICALLPPEYHQGAREVYDAWPDLLYPVAGMPRLVRATTNILARVRSRTSYIRWEWMHSSSKTSISSTTTFLPFACMPPHNATIVPLSKYFICSNWASAA